MVRKGVSDDFVHQHIQLLSRLDCQSTNHHFRQAVIVNITVQWINGGMTHRLTGCTVNCWHETDRTSGQSHVVLVIISITTDQHDILGAELLPSISDVVLNRGCVDVAIRILVISDVR